MTVLRFIGPGPRRKWERRRSVLAIFGRSQLGAEVSSRQLEARGEFSRGWACRVLRELRDDRVLVEVWPASGVRAAAYRINPNIGEWRNVPWTVDDLRLVVAEVMHVELLGAPNLRPVARSDRRYRDAVRTGGAVNPPEPRHKHGQRRGGGTFTATVGSASGAVNAGSARHGAGGLQKRGSGSSGGNAYVDGGFGSAPAAGLDLADVRARASIEQWVKKRLGLPFFRGARLAELVELSKATSLEEVYEAIEAHEPDPHQRNKEYRITDLVADVAFRVLGDRDRLAALETADEPTDPPPSPQPEAADGPSYREWVPGDSAPVIPIEERLANPAQQARAALRGGLDSTETEEVHEA